MRRRERTRKGSAGSYYYNYYLKDHLGSTRMVINDAGDITDAIMYQPYGTMEEVAGIATPGADPERERFTGKEFDREGKDSANGIPGLNAYYFGARFLDPDIGIFISTDPTDEMWNSYSYTGGNPIIFIDPNGMEVDQSTYGDNTNFAQASQAAVNNPVLALKIEQMVSSPNVFSDAAFAGMSDPGFGQFLSSIMPYQDYGISMMKDATGYVNDIAWLVPPAKIPVALINGSFTIADWAMKYHQSGVIPTQTMLLDGASYGLGKFLGKNAKGTLGTIGEEIISNSASRGFSETSNAILKASKK
jgi:RHS repeat-associated protein